MRLYVFHQTKYLYPSPVKGSFNELRLYPISNEWQKCESCFIHVLPSTQLRQYLDLNGNIVNHFEIPQDHSKLIIESRSTITTHSRVDFNALPYGKKMSTLKEMQGQSEARPYLQSSSFVEINPESWRLAVDVQADSKDIFQTAYMIMEFIFQNFEYSNSITSVETHGNQALKLQKGVCQDFAHAALVLCRCLGIPARYVSGYVFDRTRDQSIRGAEASHAWIEILVNGFGWFGLDPTNNQVVDENYIVLGTGMDYKDVAPVTGTYFGKPPRSMEVNVTVKRMDSSDR